MDEENNPLLGLDWQGPENNNQLVPDNYMSRVAEAESGSNPNAANPKSSALGDYQFTSGTWSDMMTKHPELGLTENGRTDPTQATKAMEAFTADNSKYLAGVGVPVNDGSLYAAHFLGAPRAASVLSSNPDEKLVDILPHSVIEANPFLKNMSVSDFKNWSDSKMSGKGQISQQQIPGQTTQQQTTNQPQVSATGLGNKDLLKLMLLASLGNVRLQPVDYDPFKLQPNFGA